MSGFVKALRRESRCPSSEDILSSTPASLKELQHRTVIITGANSGIGAHTALALAATGCTLVLASRDISKCEAVAKEIRQRHAGVATVHVMSLDLASLAAVRAFATEFQRRSTAESWPRVGCLILNAGVVMNSYQESREGFELTWAVNHLGHFLLTQLLMPELAAAYLESGVASRVVVVASDSHFGVKDREAWQSRQGLIDNVIQPSQPAQGMQEALRYYSNSKLANVLFASQLQALHAPAIRACALHPGTMMATDIGRDSSVVAFAMKWLLAPFTKSMSQGAATTVKCAILPPEELTGQYWRDCVPVAPSKLGQDAELARTLWEVSEELVRPRAKL